MTNRGIYRHGIFSLATISTAAIIGLSGCQQNPLYRTTEQELRDRLIQQHTSYIKAVAEGPVVEVSRQESDVEKELTPERRDELDKMSGPTAYEGVPLELGTDLLSKTDTPVVPMSLYEAIRLAVKNNLDVQFAQLQPAVNESVLTQTEAVFDAVWFVELGHQNTDTPTPPQTFAPPGAGPFVREKTLSLTTGIRKGLSTGGTITISTEMQRQQRNPSFYAVPSYYNANAAVTLAQPLLRGFGQDVSRAQIVLAASAREQSVQELRQTLMDAAVETERAYWDLVLARQQLLILSRLLQRTIDDRDQLKKRNIFDVSPVRLTEANSFVELRRADVIRARQQVRVASDRLKQLINSPDLPIASEALIIPVEVPADLPIKFSLLDAVTTALRNRPEMQIALQQISDATTRQRVADNLRLPQLDLSFTTRFNGVGIGGVDRAYDDLTDGDFIDYLVNVAFSVPIGNRGPEAQFRQRQLERQSSVLNYQRGAQRVVLEVKESLRNLITAYELIGAARAARRAASDNLRAIEAQEEAGVALTPEFLLDLKLAAQQRVADAETQEMRALTDYNTAITQLYRAMGTLLEHNNIEFVDPK